jgi:mRNA interferase RelE/StbE
VSNGYSVVFDPKAWDQLMRLPLRLQERVTDAIEGLEVEPRPSGVTKLSGNENYYRIRVSDYRIIYEIRDNVLLVLILKIGHRSDVYKSP